MSMPVSNSEAKLRKMAREMIDNSQEPEDCIGCRFSKKADSTGWWYCGSEAVRNENGICEVMDLPF